MPDSPSTVRCAVGIDIGGSKIAGGLIEANGRVLRKEIIPTQPERGAEALFQETFKLAEAMMKAGLALGLQPVGIGIGICELVGLEGDIISAQTVPWRGLAIRERFAPIAPAVIEADCRAAALCEARLGAGRGFPTFLYVTIGTGISCALVIDGVPYRGARGATGTMATSPLPVWCSECGEISSPVLEEVASGPGLVSHYNRQRGAAVARAEEILLAASTGDAAAQGVIQAAGEALGGMIALLVNTLDPHAVVIGGGLGSAAGAYGEILEASARRHIWSETQRDLPIVKAAYAESAGLIGAALVAMDAVSGAKPA